jgi:hypothetical protein
LIGAVFIYIMSLVRAARTRCPSVPSAFLQPVSRRTLFSRARRRATGDGLGGIDVQTLRQRHHEWHRDRQNFLRAGVVAGLVSIAVCVYKLNQALKKPAKLDSLLPAGDPLGSGGIDRKVVVLDEQGEEKVPTGNATVPDFPRVLRLADNSAGSTATVGVAGAATPVGDLNLDTTEYTLVGLGLRTVTLLGFQVYVVGFYVATADVAALQAALVKKINPIGTTLIPGEREELRKQLLDPAKGDEIWNGLLKDGMPARSVFRIVPVRDTDFHHLRDGFVRAIQARADGLAADAGAGFGRPETDLGEAVRDFRGLFNRGSVPKKREMILQRDSQGKLNVFYDDGARGGDGKPLGRRLLGAVLDERISRALWLNYLAGKKVASEPARRSIVEGVMEFVERPVGTVATQVVAVIP